MFISRTGCTAKNTLVFLARNSVPLTNGYSNAGRCMVFLVRNQQLNTIRTISTKSIGNPLVDNRTVSKNSRDYYNAAITSPQTVYGNIGETRSETVKPAKLPHNIVFRYCPTVSRTEPPVQYDMMTHSSLTNSTAVRPLILLFAWMQSKEQHIEKYREFWFERGYDVLSVRTLPQHLLLPGIGGRNNAVSVFNFLSTISPKYDEVLVHAFSVGGYQLSEYLHLLTEQCQKGDKAANRLYHSIKGFIVDSCVFAEECPPGLSRAITTHPIWQPILEKSIRNFLKLTKSFTMNRYIKVSQIIFNNERLIPGIMLYSKDDIVSSVECNERVHTDWAKNGGIAKHKCWDSSPHVLHYKTHPEEYEQEVDNFIKFLNITKAKRQNLLVKSEEI